MRGLIYIDTVVELLLVIDDDVLRCGQSARGRQTPFTRRGAIATARPRCDGHARYHRTRWRCGGGEGARHGDSRLDRLEYRDDIRTRAVVLGQRARRRGLLRAAGWQRRRMGWSRYGVVVCGGDGERTLLVGWLDKSLSFASRSLRHATRCLLA